MSTHADGGAAAVGAVITTVSFAAGAFSPLPETAGEAVIACRKANALPLATAEPGSGQDLEPL